ncbi:MAG: hypothetical protein AB8U25_00265 [Rickettsiales endosymbiont of Dermacentor nuttalli]
MVDVCACYIAPIFPILSHLSSEDNIQTNMGLGYLLFIALIL